jgi:hypothetical protein
VAPCSQIPNGKQLEATYRMINRGKGMKLVETEIAEVN